MIRVTTSMSSGNLVKGSLNKSEKWSAYLFTVCLLLSNVALLWFITIFRLLELIQTEQCQVIMSLGIGMTAVDCAVKFGLKYLKSRVIIQWKEVVITFKQEIFLLCYLFGNLGISLSDDNSSLSFFLYSLDLIAIVCLFRRARALFTHFRIRSYMTAYKSYFKLLDLLTNMFMVQYLLTILIYVISYQNPSNNWLIHFGHSECTDLERLFYSFYFVNTTMLTIGYGDIVPVNNAQIACVLIVQIFGVVVFSYVISEIGYTLSTIRKEDEHLEHNISTLAKMSEYYGLQEQLTNLAKSYLINNQKSREDIYPQEENEVLMKLNDDLREAITQENSLSIVKSSLFFICHWSKRCQMEIAKRLIKKILNPNEFLTQALGKERIYIIKSGKLQVYTNNCFGFRQHFKKLLKTIEPNPKAQVSDNIYGYTQVFSSRIVKLNAVSKSFSCVYFIDKQHFLECVNDHKHDHQYYFEIKAKIDESQFCQAWEAPNILNIRQHFRPNIIFVIKKHISHSNKMRNSRKTYFRRDRSDIIRHTKLYQNFNNEEADFERMNSTAREIHLTDYEPSSLPKKIVEIEKTNPSEQKTITKEEMLLQKFEIPKEYHKFFPRHNLTKVLTKLQIENYMSNRYGNGEEDSQDTNNRLMIEQSPLSLLTSSALTKVHNVL